MRGPANSRRPRCSGPLPRSEKSARSTPLDLVAALREKGGKPAVADEVHGADDDEHVLVPLEHLRHLPGPARIALVDQGLGELRVAFEIVLEAPLEPGLVAAPPGIEHRADQRL